MIIDIINIIEKQMYVINDQRSLSPFDIFKAMNAIYNSILPELKKEAEKNCNNCDNSKKQIDVCLKARMYKDQKEGCLIFYSPITYCSNYKEVAK